MLTTIINILIVYISTIIIYIYDLTPNIQIIKKIKVINVDCSQIFFNLVYFNLIYSILYCTVLKCVTLIYSVFNVLFVLKIDTLSKHNIIMCYRIVRMTIFCILHCIVLHNFTILYSTYKTYDGVIMCSILCNNMLCVVFVFVLTILWQ